MEKVKQQDDGQKLDFKQEAEGKKLQLWHYFSNSVVTGDVSPQWGAQSLFPWHHSENHLVTRSNTFAHSHPGADMAATFTQKEQCDVPPPTVNRGFD